MTAVDPLMTTAEVAAALRVSPSTVTRLAQAKRLRGLQVGQGASCWRFKAADVEAFIAGSMNCRDPKTAANELDPRAKRRSGRPLGGVTAKTKPSVAAPEAGGDQHVH